MSNMLKKLGDPTRRIFAQISVKSKLKLVGKIVWSKIILKLPS